MACAYLKHWAWLYVEEEKMEITKSDDLLMQIAQECVKRKKDSRGNARSNVGMLMLTNV
jgi:hypothetical protein